MTIHELNQLRYLDKEIQLLRERLAELRAEAERVTPSVTTYINEKKETCVLPKTGGAGLHRDKMADMVAAIIEEEQQLEELCERRRQEKALYESLLYTVTHGISHEAATMPVGRRLFFDLCAAYYVNLDRLKG